MITNKQIKELERLFNDYSCMLESHKDEEQRYNNLMIGVQKAVGILGYEIEFKGETVSYGYASYGVKYDEYKLVKKKNSQNTPINDMMKNIRNIISDLEEKRDSIEDKAHNEDRDITEEEQEKLDKISEQVCSLYDCADYIENAMDCLEDYKD